MDRWQLTRQPGFSEPVPQFDAADERRLVELFTRDRRYLRSEQLAELRELFDRLRYRAARDVRAL